MTLQKPIELKSDTQLTPSSIDIDVDVLLQSWGDVPLDPDLINILREVAHQDILNDVKQGLESIVTFNNLFDTLGNDPAQSILVLFTRDTNWWANAIALDETDTLMGGDIAMVAGDSEYLKTHGHMTDFSLITEAGKLSKAFDNYLEEISQNASYAMPQAMQYIEEQKEFVEELYAMARFHDGGLNVIIEFNHEKVHFSIPGSEAYQNASLDQDIAAAALDMNLLSETNNEIASTFIPLDTHLNIERDANELVRLT